MRHPQYAVSKWIGHSITVSGRHYANAVPDELFDRAAGIEMKTSAAKKPLDVAINSAQRQAQRKASETSGTERKQRMSA